MSRGRHPWYRRHEKVVVHVLLEVTDSFGEEARTNEKDEVGHDDGESADRRARSESVDEEADKKSADEANSRRDGDGCGGLAEQDTADENDGFHALAQDGNERGTENTQRPARPWNLF